MARVRKQRKQIGGVNFFFFFVFPCLKDFVHFSAPMNAVVAYPAHYVSSQFVWISSAGWI